MAVRSCTATHRRGLYVAHPAGKQCSCVGALPGHADDTKVFKDGAHVRGAPHSGRRKRLEQVRAAEKQHARCARCILQPHMREMVGNSGCV